MLLCSQCRDDKGKVLQTNWTVDPYQYELSMTVTSQIAFAQGVSTDPNVEVAAFVGTECRGWCKLQYEENSGKWLCLLMIYSNAANEQITLRAYNPQKRDIFEYEGKLTFKNDSSVDDIDGVLVFLKKVS
ncbi:hypothetical protein FACS1894201_04950 [Bacteroidia bacterium]|nr:hypothetical protein FACS1894201_04950 [Bacteroidia bacterium]